MSALASLPALLLSEAAASPQSVTTWTDKEVVLLVGAVLASIATVCIFLVKKLIASARSLAKLKQENEGLKDRMRKRDSGGEPPPKPDPIGTGNEDLKGKLGKIEAELETAKKEAVRVSAALAAAKDNEATLKLSAQKLEGELVKIQGNVKEYQADIAAERRRIQQALRKDGQTWTEKVRANAPDFKSLEPDVRRTPIVSVLNLKGGVGKTTITANLGAALDALGYRVLLLDLDLQGSLTGLFLSDAEQERLGKEGSFLEDFLTASFGAEFPNLLDYTQPILPKVRSGLVPTTDSLAYAETNLTIRWLLREANRDPRFLLRRELQLKRVTNAYDIILLDCPPLINICCVNALAASDYLLIPVLPSHQATARVPILLKRLKEFREGINPALKVLGVLSNRTHRSELTYDEENRLTLLQGQCKDVWGLDVPQFHTYVRQSTEIRTAEDEHRPLRSEDEVFQSFLDLAREVTDRLPMFCRPADTVGAQPQGASQ
jgi:chromosome partitioning protein